jgi:hypothetical protein
MCNVCAKRKSKCFHTFFRVLPEGIDTFGSWKSWLFLFLLRWSERPLEALCLVGIRSLECWKLMQIVLVLSVCLRALGCTSSLSASVKTELYHTHFWQWSDVTATSGVLVQKEHYINWSRNWNPKVHYHIHNLAPVVCQMHPIKFM